jgi:hypothetical protein
MGPTVTSDPDARLIDLDVDDGVIVQAMTSAFTGSIVVNVQGVTLSRLAFISAWVDFNGNGVWETSEKINVTGRIANGDNTISFPVPAGSKTDAPVWMRVRLSSTDNLLPTGLATDGEVEDYSVRLTANPYQNASNPLDVNGDGFVSPIDVLQLVNYLNFNGGGRLPFPVAFAIPPYLDVDGDGSVGPLDVLTVINYINSNSTGGGAEGEGFGSSDWISASSLAAPGIASGHKQEASSQSSSQQSIATNKIQSLDQYLARVASDMGPSLAVDDLDWSATLPALEEVKDKDRDFAVALAIDDLLSDWE